MPFLAHTRFPPPAVPLSHTACREARTPARSSPHHSHTGPHSYSGALLHTGAHSHSWLLAHNASHPFYACVAARILPHSCTHTLTPHTPGPHSQLHTRGHSPWGFSPPQELPGSSYPPSSACTRPQHSPPPPRAARPNPPGRDRLQGGILPPLVPEGGHPAAHTGSPHALRALPHCPSLPLCVCVLLQPCPHRVVSRVYWSLPVS